LSHCRDTEEVNIPEGSETLGLALALVGLTPMLTPIVTLRDAPLTLR